MPKTLLVDTNFAAAPLLHALERRGHEVWIMGGHPNDFMAKSAPRYIARNYAEPGALAEVINELKPDYLVPGCTDRSYIACAQANVDLAGTRGSPPFIGIDTVSNTHLINNKNAFRQAARNLGLSVPTLFEDAGEVGNTDVIVKPADAYSGRGISIVKEPTSKTLEAAVTLANKESRTGTCVIEQYVQGQLHSHSALISKGKVIADFLVEEHGTANPFTVDTSRVLVEPDLNLLNRIRRQIELLAQGLSLVDGLVHTQFIVQGEQFWLIEITRRCPGDLYSQLIELSTGYSYPDQYVRGYLGLAVQPNEYPSQCQKAWIMRHTLTVPQACTLDHVQFHAPLRIRKWVPISSTGDALKPSPLSRIGVLFAQCENQSELDSLYQQTLARKLYTLND